MQIGALTSKFSHDQWPLERIVEWAGGATSEFTVVNADGPHVCGVTGSD